ncbi:MAG: 4Fe-4S dicluster domain-containing protein [Chloroflexota bacterium]|nr:4Fe-4S dicluster domain-containing protein [Chloroflexota bacterium]
MTEAFVLPSVSLIADYRKCCGCRICEVVCSIKHFGEFNPELSRIRVYDFYHGLIQVPAYCWGCRAGTMEGDVYEEAFCIEACPEEGALTWHPSLNIPVLNEELCTQCGMCVDACRAKGVMTNPKTGFPLICDRCDGDPSCVKQCPTGALEGCFMPTTMERFYALDSPEEVAEKMKNHMFYPWKGLEDWRD